MTSTEYIIRTLILGTCVAVVLSLVTQRPGLSRVLVASGIAAVLIATFVFIDRRLHQGTPDVSIEEALAPPILATLVVGALIYNIARRQVRIGYRILVGTVAWFLVATLATTVILFANPFD